MDHLVYWSGMLEQRRMRGWTLAIVPERGWRCPDDMLAWLGEVNVTKTIVSMDDRGRLTVPIAAREALQIDGATQFELEITETALILRPSIVVPREDAWAYTPDHMRRVD
jgi:bifunctional DNA-binding transcriptional regulator/antitoxin component of YhaV-PrlF toxin-antitoxin module